MNTIEIIKNILVHDIGVDIQKDEIGLEDGFQLMLGLDSVGFVELRFQCEQTFGITIKDEDFIPNNFKNIAVLSTLVERLKS